jgi:hypothetical protein
MPPFCQGKAEVRVPLSSTVRNPGPCGLITPVRVSDAIDVLACDAFQRADRTHQRGSDNVDGRDPLLHPNSACGCFVHRCLVHRAAGSIRNR